MRDDARVDALCDAYGILRSFTGGDGRQVDATADGKRHALTALGIDIATDVECSDSLAQAQSLRTRPLPALLPIEADKPTQVTLRDSGGSEWTIETEAGDTFEGRSCDPVTLDLPPLPHGYHRLTLAANGKQCVSTLLSAPDRCYLPAPLEAGARHWGATAQVYSLRGAHDVGLGSYADVATLAEAVGERGGAFLGLSPVHALFGADASKYSPYSPSSRLFLQTSLIAPHLVRGFDAVSSESAPTPGGAGLIDYATVLPQQRKMLEVIWAATHAQATRDMAAFARDGGERLAEHATFEALSDHFSAQGLSWSGAWPTDYRDARSSGVTSFRREHSGQVAFHTWLQWLADRQLADAASAAERTGMTIGLYRDLAVGADRGGSEVWSAPERFIATLSVGAPPDPLGPLGQDWGLPPLHPLTLASTGLAAFRDLVAANMRHAGAIRIDHAFQLQRLFVLPVGGVARDGVYLSYPLAALLAALKIESHRAKCLIIGEDLGTAPKGFSDAIMAAGILSYRLLPFERGEGGMFKPPSAYPQRALAALATHDLPTFAGWWRGLDNDVRECLGVFDPARARVERAGRAADRLRLRDALAAEGLAATACDDSRAPDVDALRFLARSPSALVAMQLEDVLREPQQANLPGPDCGHPNWRRRSSVPVERLATHPGLDRVAAAFRAEGRSSPDSAPCNIPRATYRLQLHAKFTFDDATSIVPYLARLGVSHVYVSPIQMASPGSTHGYDVVDPSRLNPELGGEDGFRRFSDTVLAHDLRLLVDIVPNHVGVGGKDNPWWLDVLEWGRQAEHAGFFDIDWDKPRADGKLIVPFLGAPFEALLAKTDICLGFERDRGRFAVWYADHCHPVSPLDYAMLLERARPRDMAAADTVRVLADAFAALSNAAAGMVPRARALQRRLTQACETVPEIASAIATMTEAFSGADLRDLCARQHWRLICWTEASERINYRRFFDITSLAGVRIEEESVFEASHRVIFDLVEEGRIQGLRVDHVDGLADPAGYLERLQARVGPGFFIAVEKILEPGEALPRWPIAGTTGYDFLHTLDAVFFDGDALPVLDAIERDVVGGATDRDRALIDIKIALAEKTFISECAALAGDIASLTALRADDILPALRALLAAFPVYRTYGTQAGLSEADRTMLAKARGIAVASLPPAEQGRLDAIVDALSANPASRAMRRFQQLTGPLMAKSFEDTLFYRDARFIAANEVGCGPAHPGIDAAEFHRANGARQEHWPASMIATATHDTKRGEDARGRLLAASHTPDAWRDAWTEFRAQPGVERLALADVSFLFQSLIAACPIAPSDAERTSFADRACQFSEKFLREGKQRSSWTAPDADYEKAVCAFVKACAKADGILFARLAPFIRANAIAGARLGIARTILKMTIPGVPDIYQGTELTDLSFVDPDNRRPVDFLGREALCGQSADPVDDAVLLGGAAKFYALAALLDDRRAHPATYRGSYCALATTDDHAALAFARGDRDDRITIVASRSFTPSATMDWHVALPPGHWRNLFDGKTLEGDRMVVGSALLGTWPAVVMRRLE